MKKLLIAATILLFTFPALAAEEFVPITKNSEVTSIDQVRVKKVVTEQKVDETVYTLPQVDADIAKIQARIDHLQGDIDKLKALKAEVLKEAEKIELKKEEAPKPIEEVK
jgi:TolA-binding protein